jgi:ribosome recycling factor
MHYPDTDSKVSWYLAAFNTTVGDIDVCVPLLRPTVETRNSLQTVAQREAENTRVQLRKHHQASIKKGKFGKHSVEMEEVRVPSLVISG